MNTINFAGREHSPSKIVCIGRNYVAHAKELGNAVPKEPVIFSKPNSSITSKLSAQHQGEVLHYEGELSFLVEAGKLVGVGFGLDLTKRITQNRLKEAGLPWDRAKAFKGAALFSDFVAIDDQAMGQLTLCLEVDGVIRQQGGIEHMLFKPQAILEEITGFMELYDGDIIMTGTPSGVGEIKSGECFSAKVFNGNQCLLQAEWVAYS